MSTTTYDIRVNYLLDDKASRGIAAITKQAQQGAKSTSTLSRTIGALAASAAGFFTFRLAKKVLIDYNSELEQAKIQMQGLLQLNMGGDWARNQKRANFLLQRFREDAKASVGTTKDYVDMGSMITGPLSRAGASMEDIANVTKGAVVSAKSFGVEAEFAARDIESALQGTLSAKDRFARALLEPMGMTTKKWNELVTKSPQKAAQMLVKAFNQPAIKKMAAEQEKSWGGVTSTFKDNLERALGKIGIPLMQKLVKEFDRLNKWFDANPQKVKEITDAIARNLVSAFETVKSVMIWVVEHKDLLISLAKAALLLKGANLAGSLLGIGSVSSILTKGFATLAAELGLVRIAIAAGGGGGLTGKLGLAGMAIAGGAYAGYKLRKAVDGQREDRKSRGRHVGWMQEDIKKGRADLEFYKIKGYLDESGNIDMNKLKRTTLEGGAGKLSMVESRQFPEKVANLIRATQIMKETEKAGAIAQSATQAQAWRSMYDRAPAWGQRIMDNMAASMVNNAVATLDPAFRQMFAELGGGMRQMAASSFGWLIPGLRMPGDDVSKDKGKVRAKGGDTNIKIQKIEVVSDDPDRFAFNLVGAFQDYNKSPTQARGALNSR